MPKFKDLSGQTFQNLLVIKYLGRENGCGHYLCRCLLCGKEFAIIRGSLKKQISCSGCAYKKKTIDITGLKYGKLTAISLAYKKGAFSFWKCLCDCGNEVVVMKSYLVAGHTKSCGCIRRDLCSKRLLKHGATGTTEYNIWKNIIARTTSTNLPCSNRYIGRGITVCDEWRHSFEQFYKDMGAKPTPKHTIDRINNDGGYSPDNCRWATYKEQNSNKSNTVHVTINGITKTTNQWSAITGVSNSVIHRRIKRGWNPVRATTESARKITTYKQVRNNQYTKHLNINILCTNTQK